MAKTNSERRQITRPITNERESREDRKAWRSQNKSHKKEAEDQPFYESSSGFESYEETSDKPSEARVGVERERSRIRVKGLSLYLGVL